MRWLLVLLVACHHGSRPGLPDDLAGAKSICYSGYRTGQSPDEGTFPSVEQIREDLQLLDHDGYRYLRLFDSGTHAQRVLEAVTDQKVILGVWIGKDEAANRAEIDRAVALVAAHPDRIIAVSVGNETLDDWSDVRTSPADLAGYIDEVRAKTGLPVTTDDSWLVFTLPENAPVIDAVDFLDVHVYAYADAYYGDWNWNQEAGPQLDAAIAYSKDAVRQVRAHAPNLPIVVGEIGWKSATKYKATDPPEQAIETHLADPMKQKQFDDRIDRWVRGPDRDADSPDGAFFFEAFDEPWKDGDDGWGFYTTDRRKK
jgi:exo-beta-1,3-glucanase (GH17 family)